MKLFAELYFALDSTNNPDVKVRALAHYFRQAPPEDAIWALGLLLEKKPRRTLPLADLSDLALETANIPFWLFEESLTAVKDRLEAVTLLLPQTKNPKDRLLHVWLGEILPALQSNDPEVRQTEICACWEQMDFQQRFIWNKLLTGTFRMSPAASLVLDALSAFSGIERTVLAYRLKQKWDTSLKAYHALFALDTSDAEASRPYPFVSRQVLERTMENPGEIQDWHIEWDWEGLRVQCVKRQGQFFLWSQDTELLTDRFPELHKFGQALPDGVVIEAQIVGWRGNSALAGETLQTRIRRKHLSKKLLQETPIRVFALDLLEYQGQDIRNLLFSQRRAQLSALLTEVPDPLLHFSPEVHASCWSKLDNVTEKVRVNGPSGLILTLLNEHSTGWWRWKAQPFTMLGVLLYAQRRQGQSMSIVSEYSFSVWDGGVLVKVATIRSGLTEEEQEEIDRFVKENTLERFGPVRSVKAELVFEISFEGIRKSARHKAGLKLDTPKITRWRREKSKEEASSLAMLQALLCE